jgi:hypothetical protein
MTDNLKVSSPDFSEVKQNLINFLKNQSEFSDYNFDGSAINFLLDILAYNTHYNVVHTNLGFAETFLDSAAVRSSVVSRAKELGYTPRSKSGALASIRVSFAVSGNPSQYVLPQGTNFSSSNGSQTYNFTTTEDIVFANDGNNVFSKTIDIYQGKYTTYQYTINLNDPLQRIIVPDKNVDTRFLTVSYKTTSSSTSFTEVENVNSLSIANLTPTTEVYFLKETYDGYFEVYFGDDVIGRSLKNGNIVKLDYLITDGKEVNGARNFSLASTIPAISSTSITTIDVATGGDDKETIESIKFLAPFYYQSQGRAVTEDDTIALVKNTYSNVDDVAVWGGEKNDPPFYGKIFIAIKPSDSTIKLTNATKEYIKNDMITRFNVVSVRPEIVDPDYIFVAVDVVVRYNTRLYNRNTSTLETDVQSAIEDFFSNETNKFGKPLFFSKLVSEITSISPVIKDAIVNLKLSKQKEIFTGVTGEYIYSFNNAISVNSIYSNDFTIGGNTWSIKDIPDDDISTTGTLAVFRMSGDNIIYYTRDAGTVNYNTGEIIVENLQIDSIVDDPIYKRLTINASPGPVINVDDTQTVYLDTNVYTNERDQIISLKDSGITITLVADTTG